MLLPVSLHLRVSPPSAPVTVAPSPLAPHSPQQADSGDTRRRRGSARGRGKGDGDEAQGYTNTAAMHLPSARTPTDPCAPSPHAFLRLRHPRNAGPIHVHAAVAQIVPADAVPVRFTRVARARPPRHAQAVTANAVPVPVCSVTARAVSAHTLPPRPSRRISAHAQAVTARTVPVPVCSVAARAVFAHTLQAQAVASPPTLKPSPRKQSPSPSVASPPTPKPSPRTVPVPRLQRRCTGGVRAYPQRPAVASPPTPKPSPRAPSPSPVCSVAARAVLTHAPHATPSSSTRTPSTPHRIHVHTAPVPH
ncbi:hypothetical protein PLICRDRAFT_181003 [Plicaturopsis crispa FD-325 SS-3]|uniref:Uncharacterized protein n=1 Tax=Plicaturopsis crispa FD-325 SS-3 TaxID=944288 RepID=A0A0C9T401_PLICR|nr:hypothetical protein PLICRDRAFT_181003 [Plicaturopsis crispa FD-325 SS-3]